ncbi:hypothetical protein [Solicola sp. PLA-1-18]|uniref:hypothetical protein n=1 Tax=Solicola sp. PLA-1-18 TaxID=3380532 RepID=UPI003B7712A5
MGPRERLTGAGRRAELSARAVRDARNAEALGLREFAVTVHDLGPVAARMPRTVAHVVAALEAAGFDLVGSRTDPSTASAHLALRCRQVDDGAVHRSASGS